ncbi:hypothetical protein [Halopseudomonas sp.]|uniref:hypothetical protein n=1 Tax=Halopseudomonas sp. TaxID=2901191 RepID=UPI00300389BE
MTALTTHAQICEIALEQGKSPQVVRKILHDLGAPPELIDLPRIITGLQRTLRAAELDKQIPLDGCDFHVWYDTCDWICSLATQPHAMSRLGGKFWLGTIAPTRSPLVGRGVTSYGFPYAALWHAPLDREHELDYFRLVAHLLAATNRLDLSHELKTQRYQVFSDLRRMCKLDSLDIPAELLIWETHYDFVNSCRRFSPAKMRRKDASDVGALFFSVARLVRYAHGENPQTRAGGGGRRRPGAGTAWDADLTHLISNEFRGFPLADPDDPDQLPGFYNVQTTDIAADESCQGELAPGELTAQVEIWELRELDEGLPDDRPYVAYILSMQGMRDHIIRTRQYLPHAYAHFTLTELRTLLFGTGKIFGECLSALSSRKVSHNLQLRMEAIVVLHISLWLGQPITQVVQLTAVKSQGEAEDVLSIVTAADEPSEFSVVVQKPHLMGFQEGDAEAYRKSSSRLVLPDLAGAEGMVRSLMKAYPRKSAHVFELPSAELEKEGRDVLKLLGEGDPRYTLGKVRNYVLQQLIADTGDVASASLLSGVPMLSARTPLYYLQLDSNYLRHIYQRSIQRILTQVYACGGLAYEPVSLDTHYECAVGASHCLLPETITANVAAMQRIVRPRPTGRLNDLIQWHNTYTLYVVQFFMLATGCRAIKNPLMHIDQFDSRSMMGAMSDKDGADRHMSRLCCLPPMMMDQLSGYFAHCRAMARQLIGYLEPDEDEQWVHGWFLEAGEIRLRRLEIRPATITQQMQRTPGFTPHRINGFRKFLRTEFTEAAHPSESLATFMGHWLSGEEPQDPYSSFSPAVHSECVVDAIQNLLKKLGWIVLSSPWVQEARSA